jgi:hypothetical protein
MLEFSEHTLTTPIGERVALVIAPTEAVRVGLDRIVPRVGPPRMSSLDQQVLEQAEARAPRIQLGIFRGANGHGGSWGFDPAMDEHEAIRLAEYLLPGQMIVYRGLLRLGVCLFVHIDWGSLECAAFRAAAAKIADGLHDRLSRGSAEPPNPADVVDLWVLRNLTFFFSLSFDHLVSTILPEKLALMEKRMERIQRMAEAI